VSKADDKADRLNKTLAALQARWGPQALRRLARVETPTLSSGFRALDQLLGRGGLPRGHVVEIIGRPTSGMATLALRMVAAAQKQQPARQMGYVDLPRTFDPDYAARCGVALERLVLIHPPSLPASLPLLHDLIASDSLLVVIWDAPRRLLADQTLAGRLDSTLARLTGSLRRSGSVLLFLTSLPAGGPATLDQYPAASPLPHHAAVRLLLQRERWLYRQHDIVGYGAQVLMVKNKLGRTGRDQAGLRIYF
jgi:recombination protein RecA